MNSKVFFILNWLIKSIIYLLVFLVPLFFLPVTIEKLELNKYFLFYFLTLLAFLCFLGTVALKKGFEIKRTPLDIPLLLLWVILLVSSIASQDRYLSFFGDFGSLKISFIGFSLMLIFYFLVVQNFSQPRQILRLFYVFLASGFLAALFFLSGQWTFFSWQKNNFLPVNLISSSNVIFGFFVSLIFVLSLGFLAIKKKARLANYFIFFVFLISLIVLFILGFKFVWVIAAIGLLLIGVFFLSHLGSYHPLWTSLILFFLVAALLFSFFGEPGFLSKKMPLEVSLSPLISWEISWNVLRDNAKNFILGSGPGTFVYDFSKYRPETMNYNVMWNARFNQPYSSVFEFLATGGWLTFLMFLSVIFLILGFFISLWLKYILRSKNQRHLSEENFDGRENYEIPPLFFWLVACAWLMILVSLFFINFGMVHWLAFWLFLALAINASVYLSRSPWSTLFVSLKTTPQYALVTSFVFILLFAILIILGVYLGRFYTGEVVFGQGLSQDYEKRITYFSRAISYNQARSSFYLGLADSFLGRALELANQNGDKAVVSEYVASAVNAAKQGVNFSPNNVAAWEHLAAIYDSARPVAPEANAWVISSLEKALELENNNPAFYLSLGNAKLLDKRFSEAKEDFEKALKLKPDFLLVYIRLAFLYESQDNLNSSIATLEKGLSYGVNNPEYLFQLGRYYFNRNGKGDYANAELALRKALSLNPNYSDALFALAYLYEKTGNKSVALELYKQVYELNPGNKDLVQKINSLNYVPAPPEEVAPQNTPKKK
ncbi:MAG: Tetratricopeptide [Candidatus Magasanikbacteria bacterium GW2011_GWC2_40_17]|uniref:Tetratricopeptide n=1 Tax=Candidatus Magasanikbacteria bacterium GW2011_GWA2_42_32 TaxID=1619039 RepID=A0A0G1A8U1_9BACT|nr:MAG: Tetratricopeptide [Candidatus Magasanikbacteria bacterium GW2011_GWC2_40_17]KKS57462.1 MAG: Tetratricopeptide [Candidatus Magasanikbacteria bacterium GW2011_GWA2_42_32]OGH85182.1 MAG: hypothetical protein A2294_00320 [Candidatus Magasanikbacteria bacterium RIFOXYB2_FULL_38_10]